MDKIASTEIALSKRKIVLMLIGSVLFVFIGLWFIIKPPEMENSFFGNKILVLITGVAAVLFFGMAAVMFLRKMQDRMPGLIVDSEGLIDNSSAVSAGRIAWKDINGLSVIEIQRQKLIMIEVSNPEEYIDRQTSGFKKRIMKMNMSAYGTPISISSNTLIISFDKLMDLLNDGLNKSRNNQ